MKLVRHSCTNLPKSRLLKQPDLAAHKQRNGEAICAMLCGVDCCCGSSLIDALLIPTTQSVTLHTTLGDIKIEVYCEQVCIQLTMARQPLGPGAENRRKLSCPVREQLLRWLPLSSMHQGMRVTQHHACIHVPKGFMCQTGDPTGTGKGGRSIYETANGKVRCL